MITCIHVLSLCTPIHIVAIMHQLMGLLSVSNTRELKQLLLIGVVVEAVRIYRKFSEFNMRRCIWWCLKR